MEREEPLWGTFRWSYLDGAEANKITFSEQKLPAFVEMYGTHVKTLDLNIEYATGEDGEDMHIPSGTHGNENAETFSVATWDRIFAQVPISQT